MREREREGGSEGAEREREKGREERGRQLMLSKAKNAQRREGHAAEKHTEGEREREEAKCCSGVLVGKEKKLPDDKCSCFAGMCRISTMLY